MMQQMISRVIHLVEGLPSLSMRKECTSCLQPLLSTTTKHALELISLQKMCICIQLQQ